MLIANGVSPDYPKSMSRAKWEYAREQAFRAVSLKWLRQDPGKILRVKVENLWNFWVRAENWQKTRLLILMQVPFLGAVMASLVILLYKRQLHRVKYRFDHYSGALGRAFPRFCLGSLLPRFGSHPRFDLWPGHLSLGSPGSK